MPELRKDPILGRWIIISKERGKRPTDFIVERNAARGGFCPLCTGNENTTPPEVLAYGRSSTTPNTQHQHALYLFGLIKLAGQKQ